MQSAKDDGSGVRCRPREQTVVVPTGPLPYRGPSQPEIFKNSKSAQPDHCLLGHKKADLTYVAWREISYHGTDKLVLWESCFHQPHSIALRAAVKTNAGMWDRQQVVVR